MGIEEAHFTGSSISMSYAARNADFPFFGFRATGRDKPFSIRLTPIHCTRPEALSIIRPMAASSLDILTSDQIQKIDRGTMRLLSETGLEVASGRVRHILSGGGAICEGSRVKFPEDLVRGKAAQVPREFSLQGTDPDQAVRIGDGQTHIQPMVGRLNILDYRGKRRRTTYADVGNIVRVCNGMPSYDILHGGAVMPQIEGIPSGMAHVAGFVQTLRNTGKPFKGSCRGHRVAEDCLSLADAVAEASGEPFTLHTTCNIVSPLQIAQDMSEGAIPYIQRGWPVDFASEPQMGATSPVTLAGTTVQTLAECLAGVVFAQTVNPGAPVFIGTVGAAMDMRHATIALGGVEGALLNAAHAQMGRYYGIPTRGTGANTNAKVLDFQAGYEKLLTLIIPVLAGVDLLFYPGTIEHAETISLESLVLDEGLCEVALRAQRGIRVTDDLIGIDLIAQTGPGGTFLGLPQTAREMFAEHLVHGPWDRQRRSDWETAGKPGPEEKAHGEVIRLLGEHDPGAGEKVENGLKETAIKIAERESRPEIIDILWP